MKCVITGVYTRNTIMYVNVIKNKNNLEIKK